MHIDYLDAAVSGLFDPHQGHGQSHHGQGKYHSYDFGSILDFDICMHYWTLYHVAITEAGLIMVEGN